METLFARVKTDKKNGRIPELDLKTEEGASAYVQYWNNLYGSDILSVESHTTYRIIRNKNTEPE